MTGFPCPDKQAVSVTHSTPPFDREAWSLHTISFTNHTHTDAHMHFYTHVPVFPQPFFFTHLVFFFFLFLNSSLFSAHVYFYPTVHGRSQRNDEAWETCSSPWQLYCKPSLSHIACSSQFYTFVALILLSHLFRSVFYCISSPQALWSSFSHACFLSWILISPRCPPLSSPLPPGADWAVFSSLNQWACCCRVILY